MPSTKVNIAGREYEIAALTIRQSRAWRTELESLFDGVASILSSGDTRITDKGSVQALLGQLKDLIVRAPDKAAELLYRYAPNIAADKEHIEENGFDEEIIAAFLEVLKLAYPLGGLTRLLSGLAARRT
jgi:hypothetical protein